MKNYKALVKKVGIFFLLTGLMMDILPIDAFAATKNFNQTASVTISAKEDFATTGKYTWIKYKAKNNGYITVTASNAAVTTEPKEDEEKSKEHDEEYVMAHGYWTLYASNKKTALSSVTDSYNTAEENIHSYTQTYGVKKNTTYYLRVNAVGAVTLKCKFTKVNENSGSKKSKAKSLDKNKTVKGIISAGDKTVDWYKIKIPKKQILNIYYSGKTNSKIKITFSGTYLKTAVKYIQHGNTQTHHTYSTERVQPGTYYVKVERYNSTSSGYYTLKWK